MISGSVVFYKIATTCLLIVVGFLARRMQLLPEISVSILSKFIVYLALPCYMIFYMPTSISPATLGLYWYFPLLGALLVAVNDCFGYLAARLWAGPGERATFRVLVGLPNWIFMALAVCEPLFKEDGVRVVVLYNAGIMFYIWTFGMTSFRTAAGWREVLRQLFLNTQTVALAVGFVLAMLFPFLRGMERLGSEELAALPFHIGVFTPLWETVSLVGGTALPLSIVQIGLLLGEPKRGDETRVDGRSLSLTIVLRLLVSPVLILGVLYLACRLGVPLTRTEFVVSAIIMSMPAATLCLTVAEVYSGATRLAAQAILWGTVASLLTAPLATRAAQEVVSWLPGM